MIVADVLVLGGGLAGLSTAVALGEHAVVLEQEKKPGGLVRSLEIDGWWFDHVIHLLHFRDEITKGRVLKLLGGTLKPLQPSAFVVTDAGTAKYPIQEHLGHLNPQTAVACAEDFVREAYADRMDVPTSYRDVLLRSFGESLCDLFFFPYNAKMWRRDLAGIAPGSLLWNLSRPVLKDVLMGLVLPDDIADAYNRDGWYPQPEAGSPLRGMEVLTRAVASEVHDLRTCHRVTAIHPASRSVEVYTPEGETTFRWRNRCVGAVSLSALVSLSDNAPSEVMEAAGSLEYNRVLSIAVRVKGPRPDVGLWRYYASRDVIFTRLIFLHAFDPLMSPAEGWPLLVEIPWCVDEPIPDDLVERALLNARQVGALTHEHEVIDATVLEANPAYVVFNHATASAVELITAWLRSQGIDTVGRFGRWEYSSMAQVLRDGYQLGESLVTSSWESGQC
jgi:protoporphyrinogen oxidase